MNDLAPLILLIGIVIGVVGTIFSVVASDTWHTSSTIIENGCGRYHPQTGVFEFLERDR